MRVNHSSSGANNTSIGATEASKTRDTSSKQADPQVHSENFDRVNLSQLSRALSNTDEGRLEKLRAAIATGSYSVPSNKISSSIVNEHIANAGRDL